MNGVDGHGRLQKTEGRVLQELEFFEILCDTCAVTCHPFSFLLINIIFLVKNEGSQAVSEAQILVRETKSPRFQLPLAPNFRIPASMWKPESSRCWSVNLFKLAQHNWNNILQLLDVLMVFPFLSKCSLQVFRFQFLKVFMLENDNHPSLFSTQNICILK